MATNNVSNEKILTVNNLRISFKTNTGTVKAVRGIDFSLYKGRTLAIVGESGSGKSVTSKAILGILANNKIVEDGEIIYDGKDLLRLPEAQFTKVRGTKISMIFQDPLSALNPIMRVGQQLTEAMFLEHKAVKKASRTIVKKYANILKTLNPELTKHLVKCLGGISALTNETSDTDGNIFPPITTEKEIFDLFKTLVENEVEKFTAALNELQAAVHVLQTNALSNEAEFDPKLLKKELNRINKYLKKTNSILEREPDDVIGVYKEMMENYTSLYIEAIKLQKHREEILAKNNVTDFFDLPAKFRTKEREVVTDKSVYYEKLTRWTGRLIRRINKLIEQYNAYGDDFINDTISYFLDSVVKSHSKLTSKETKDRAIKLMTEVGIPDPEKRYYQYPFEFSGGMRQRIVIAIALSGNPEVLICDEPTTALDVTIQAQILELINRLKAEKNLSIIFITHDLGVVANMADDIAVMYAGKIVEYGTVYDIFYDPRHPYTWALLGSMPDLDTKGKLDAIPGTPPNMLLPPKGDAFAARNAYAIALDYKQEPPFFPVSKTHFVKTWLAHKDAPQVELPTVVRNRIRNALKHSTDNMPEYDLAKNSVLDAVKKEGGIE